jgi:hypothetical protein
MKRMSLVLLSVIGILGFSMPARAIPPCPDLDTDPDAEYVTIHVAANAISLTEDDGATHTFSTNGAALIELCYGYPEVLSDAIEELGELNDVRKKANWRLKGNGVDINGIPRPCIKGYGCVRF